MNKNKIFLVFKTIGLIEYFLLKFYGWFRFITIGKNHLNNSLKGDVRYPEDIFNDTIP
jgi:hypothetical protein